MSVRFNNIYKDKIKFRNMFEAYKRASKGKKQNKEVILFELDLASNILGILQDLYNDKYSFSNYRKFKIYDPKEREILSLPFRDRVVHQWYVEEYIKPVYKDIFIKDTYACIDGRGLHLAIYTFKKYMQDEYKKNKDFYILKCDIQKFFYSIDKNVLYSILMKKYKDKRFLNFTSKIIFENTQGDVGIPIGNYTSQYFANIYLNELDHYIKEKLKIKYYVRYMDDFLLITRNREESKKIKVIIEKFLETELKLKLNKKTNYFPNKNGVKFCGFKIYTNKIMLANSNKKKINNRIRKWNKEHRNKTLDLHQAAVSFQSWKGHAMHETNQITVKSAIQKCEWIYKEQSQYY